VSTENHPVDRLLDIMAQLRNPKTGCPWDIEQTWESIAPYTIEEAYEVADAITRKDFDDLKGELGDLLLQVVYYAQMGVEENRFSFAEIADGISDKMVHRHPHVFGTESREKSADQQTADWEKIKAAERGPAGTLDGVALGLPALTRAAKLQKRAASVGFDWGETGPVLDKIAEEATELAEVAGSGNIDRIEDEMGDLLFVMVNLARHLKIDPEAALRRTNAKFERRFGAIEQALAAKGRNPANSNLAEMDALWDAAKKAERQDQGE